MASFQRTSSWPIRNERRHCATVQHNSQVLSLLGDISTRLHHIETVLGAACAPSSLRLGARTDQAVDDNQIVKRVELLEKVYVLTDWNALEIASDSMAALSTSRDTTGQPEDEMNSTKPKRTMMTEAVFFDISDHRKNAAVQIMGKEELEAIEKENAAVQITGKEEFEATEKEEHGATEKEVCLKN